jgi:hypothetical protein
MSFDGKTLFVFGYRSKIAADPSGPRLIAFDITLEQ